MDKIIVHLTQSENLKTIMLSVILIIFIQLIKIFVGRSVDRSKNVSYLDKINYKKSVKNYINILAVMLLFVLWFAQIQSVFVSLFAIAAAIVIATKELIMSFMGGILIRTNNYFRLGDRIEIDGVRGFVVEKGITVTKILQIGPEKNSQQTTGDVIVIPNSIMLSETVKNESYFKDYSIKSFMLNLPVGVKLSVFEEEVLKWGKGICSEYQQEAEEVIGSFCKKEGLIIPSVDPRSKVFLLDENKVAVMLKIPVRNQSIGDAEQAIYRNYIEYIENKI